MTNDPICLEFAGSTLFGSNWQASLAQALSVNDRTVRRWLSGETEIPLNLGNEIIVLAQERVVSMQRLIDLIDVNGFKKSFRNQSTDSAVQILEANSQIPKTNLPPELANELKAYQTRCPVCHR